MELAMNSKEPAMDSKGPCSQVRNLQLTAGNLLSKVTNLLATIWTLLSTVRNFCSRTLTRDTAALVAEGPHDDAGAPVLAGRRGAGNVDLFTVGACVVYWTRAPGEESQ